MILFSYFVSMVCFSFARAFKYSGLIKWSSSSFLFSFWEFSNRWARWYITFVNSFSIVLGLYSSFFCCAANWRSFCFSNARCSSLFWFRTFFPLSERIQITSYHKKKFCDFNSYIFWLNISSRCKFWRSDDSKQGFTSFFGTISPWASVMTCGGCGEDIILIRSLWSKYSVELLVDDDWFSNELLLRLIDGSNSTIKKKKKCA